MRTSFWICRYLQIILTSILFSFSVERTYSHEDSAPQRLDSLQIQSIRSSDLIILGRFIQGDSVALTLKFYILEIFKGNYNKDTIIIKWERHTHIFDLDKTLWLIYSNINSDSSVILNVKGLTRSIEHPETAGSYRLPPPPSPSHKMTNGESWDYNQEWLHFYLTALKDWYAELEMLRDIKKKEILNKNTASNSITTLFVMVLISWVFLIAVIIYLAIKWKKSTVNKRTKANPYAT